MQNCCRCAAYISRQKSWDALAIFIHRLPPPANNVGLREHNLREWKIFTCKITRSVSETEQHCYRGKGVCVRRNGLNSESTILFRNFLWVSQVLLSTIVADVLGFEMRPEWVPSSIAMIVREAYWNVFFKLGIVCRGLLALPQLENKDSFVESARLRGICRFYVNYTAKDLVPHRSTLSFRDVTSTNFGGCQKSFRENFLSAEVHCTTIFALRNGGDFQGWADDSPHTPLSFVYALLH